MPYNPNVSEEFEPFAPTTEPEFGVGIETFEYAKVIDAAGTSLLSEGAVYPVIGRLSAGRRFTQGIAEGRSVKIAFDNDVVLLAGVKTSSGKPDYHWWDARRFEIVESDQLTRNELEEALERF